MGIIVVGLGAGNGRLLTREAWDLLSQVEVVYLRTSRHPAVADLPAQVVRHSFDHLYETADSFQAVYETIVTELLALGKTADIVYAVPGHPFVGETTVTKLMAAATEAAVQVRVVAGISFVEATLTAVRHDALDGLQLFDALDLVATEFPKVSPDVPLLLAQVYSRLIASELKLKLMMVYPEEHSVQLVHGADTPTQQVETVPLYKIDHSTAIDHLTTLFVPPLAQSASLLALAETVAILRSPDGCPWDQEQTPQSMREGLLEEVYELIDALDRDDLPNLAEELGDVFYHLVMQTQMATEEEQFRLSDVLAGIDAKLKRRHPHVWGEIDVADSEEVVRNWEAIKQAEKGGQAQKPKSLLASIPLSLPALARSQKTQKKVAKVGFDWEQIEGVYEKLDEEIAELKAATGQVEQQAELGDVLMVVANLACWLNVDAETALREAVVRFSGRFQQVEQLVQERHLQWESLSFAEMDALWEEAKQLRQDEEAAQGE